VTPPGEIVACGGISVVGGFVNVPCYGLVAPEHQGKGVGSAMALARLAFATRTPGHHFSIIFALPKSLGFYRRFGYQERTSWKWEDGKEYPVGVLSYSSAVFGAIEGTLRKRNLLIDPSLPVAKSPNLDAVIVDMGYGRHRVELINKAINQPPEPTPAALPLRAWLSGDVSLISHTPRQNGNNVSVP